MEQIEDPTFGAFARTAATIIADSNVEVKNAAQKIPLKRNNTCKQRFTCWFGGSENENMAEKASK